MRNPLARHGLLGHRLKLRAPGQLVWLSSLPLSPSRIPEACQSLLAELVVESKHLKPATTALFPELPAHLHASAMPSFPHCDRESPRPPQ